MKTAVVNIKVDPALKAKAQARAKKLGISLSSVLHAQLYNFAEGNAIELPAEKSTVQLDTLLEHSLNSGKVGGFDSADEAIKYLNNLEDED